MKELHNKRHYIQAQHPKKKLKIRAKMHTAKADFLRDKAIEKNCAKQKQNKNNATCDGKKIGTRYKAREELCNNKKSAC